MVEVVDAVDVVVVSGATVLEGAAVVTAARARGLVVVVTRGTVPAAAVVGTVVTGGVVVGGSVVGGEGKEGGGGGGGIVSWAAESVTMAVPSQAATTTPAVIRDLQLIASTLRCRMIAATLTRPIRRGHGTRALRQAGHGASSWRCEHALRPAGQRSRTMLSTTRCVDLPERR